MSKPYETRALSLIVLPEGEAIFSEMATTITIEDDAGGSLSLSSSRVLLTREKSG